MTQKLETPTGEPQNRIWRRLAIGSAAAIALYMAGSYVAVPIIVENLIQSTLVEQTGLTATLEQVRFNPLETRLAIEGFDLPDVDNGAPLLSFDELVVDVRPLGFFGADVALDEVRLVNPRLSATIGEDGEFRLAQILSGAGGDPDESEPEDPEASDPLIIDIRAIHLEQGEVVFRDESREEPFELTLMPVTLDALDVHTRIEQTASFEFGLAIGDQTELRWTGEIGFDPLRSSGRLDLSNLDLRTPWKYLSSRLQFEIQQGELAASARYEARLDSGLELRISDGSLALKDVTFLDDRAEKSTTSTDDDESREVIDVSSVELRNIQSVVEDGALTSLDVEQASLSGGRVQVVLEEDGLVALTEILRMLDDGPSSADVAETQTESSPARIRVGNVSVRDFALDIEDRSTAQPVRLGLSELTMDVAGIDSEPRTAMNIELETRVAESGKLRLSGPVQLEPLETQFSIDVKDVSLRELGPYAARQARIEVLDGRASTQLELSIADRDPRELDVTATGRIQVDDLRIVESLGGEDLVRWKTLRLEGVEFEPQRIHVKEAAIEDAAAHFAIRADGGSNIGSVIVSDDSEAPESEEAGGKVSSQRTMRIDLVRLDSVALVLTDETVEPVFSSHLNELSGTIEGLASEGTERAEVDLQGRVNDTARLEIKGQIDPFGGAGTNDLSISVAGAPMRRFSPYSGRYVGYEIDRGELDIELDYHIENRNLAAQNRFRLDDFEFGDRVANADSTSLPVPLALGLMRNSEGVIEIDLPIQGNLDDPSFSLLGLIGDAFTNLITKVAKAPFAVIGGLVGLSGKDLSQVIFAPRSDRLSKAERSQIETLVEVLSQKTDLSVEIRGRADPEIDRFSSESERELESGRDLALARAAAIRDAIAANEQIAADRIRLLDVEIGAFGASEGVAAELSLVTR